MAGLPTAIPGPRCPGRQSVDGAHFLAVNSVCASGGPATRARQPRRAGREPRGRLRSSRPPQRPLPAAGGGASRSCRHARGAAAAGGRSGRREARRGPRGAGAGPSEARGARREPCARSQAEGAFPPAHVGSCRRFHPVNHRLRRQPRWEVPADGGPAPSGAGARGAAARLRVSCAPGRGRPKPGHACGTRAGRAKFRTPLFKKPGLGVLLGASGRGGGAGQTPTPRGPWPTLPRMLQAPLEVRAGCRPALRSRQGEGADVLCWAQRLSQCGEELRGRAG